LGALVWCEWRARRLLESRLSFHFPLGRQNWPTPTGVNKSFCLRPVGDPCRRLAKDHWVTRTNPTQGWTSLSVCDRPEILASGSQRITGWLKRILPHWLPCSVSLWLQALVKHERTQWNRRVRYRFKYLTQTHPRKT
jgi:hypothetical protein